MQKRIWNAERGLYRHLYIFFSDNRNHTLRLQTDRSGKKQRTVEISLRIQFFFCSSLKHLRTADVGLPLVLTSHTHLIHSLSLAEHTRLNQPSPMASYVRSGVGTWETDRLTHDCPTKRAQWQMLPFRHAESQLPESPKLVPSWSAVSQSVRHGMKCTSITGSWTERQIESHTWLAVSVSTLSLYCVFLAVLHSIELDLH